MPGNWLHHLSEYLCDVSLQVTEELEKVKMEMEERGSSMTDGGNSQTLFLFLFSPHCHRHDL